MSPTEARDGNKAARASVQLVIERQVERYEHEPEEMPARLLACVFRCTVFLGKLSIVPSVRHTTLTTWTW